MTGHVERIPSKKIPPPPTRRVVLNLTEEEFEDLSFLTQHDHGLRVHGLLVSLRTVLYAS